MADAQNPNNPQGTPLPNQSGPARAGSVDPASAAAILDAFNRTIPAVKAVVEQVDKIVEKMEKASKTTETQTKNVRSMSSELRQALALSDSIETTFKTLLDYQRRMAREGIKANSYKEVLTLFQDMEKESKRLVEEGVFSKKNTRLLQQNTDQIRRKIGELKDEMGKAFDKGKVERMMTEFAQMNRMTLDLAKNMKSIRLTGLKADMDSATKSVRHLFQLKDRTTKYREYAKVASDIREAREMRNAGRTADFNRQRTQLERYLPNLRQRDARGFGSTNLESRANLAKDYVATEASKRGMGRVGSYIMGRAAKERVLGQETGIITKAGMGLLARGEGSIGRGVASFGLSALEGGATSIAELAAPLAPVLAGLEVVKTLFNKNQAMNAEAATLGNSGIFAGGGNAIDNIHAVRKNLNGPLYSPLGIGYEKNLAIAKSLQENGLSNASLANMDLGQDRQGFVRGSFGQIQRNVYAYGRLAGLDSSQTVAETIKLVSQYKQSLESTHDFFIRINKEAATAGITTSKYLQIIDDVNSHYEKSNKLLEATVDTMRLLSVTGRNTAEDLQDALNTVTNGGKSRDVAASAYLNQQVLNDPRLAGMMAQRYEINRQDAMQQVQSAFGGTFNPAEWEPKLQKDLSGSIGELLARAQTQFAGDTNAIKAASSAIEGLRSAYINQRNLAFAQGEGANRGGVDLAFAQNLKGGDLISQSMQTLASLEAGLKGSRFTLKDFLEGNPALQASGAYQGLIQQAFGGDATKLEQLRSFAVDAASARAKVLQGANAQEFQNPQSEIRRIADQTIGYLKSTGYDLGTGDQYANLVKALNDNTQREAIVGRLSKSSMSLEDAFGNPVIARALRPQVDQQERDQRIQKAEELASGTRTTADIFADAFTSLFNRIQTPLDYIAKILAEIGKSKLFHLNSSSVQADENILGQLDARISGGKADTALGAYNRKIEDLEDQIAHPGTGANVEDLKKQLSDTKQHRDQLQGVVRAAQDPTQRGELTQSAVQAAIGNADNFDWNYKQVLSSADMMDLFKNKLGLDNSPLTPGQSAQITGDQFHQFEGLIDRLDPGFKVTDSKDASGKETATIINNTYNSVGFTQNQDAKNAVNSAPGETAQKKKVQK